MSNHCHDRFKTWISQTTGGDMLGEVVVAELYDAAQVELAALREELDVTDKEVEGLQSALSDAEQRNSDLIELLRDIKSLIEPMGMPNAIEKINAAINPAESGANHDLARPLA